MSNSLIAQHLKGVFSISLKKRHDNITDQYHRIFMVKFLLGRAVVLGVPWYSDNLNCVLPGMFPSSFFIFVFIYFAILKFQYKRHLYSNQNNNA